MLGKKFSLGSVVEETGEARIKLANFDELREQGSDIASFISTFKPDPGYVYLHVIAMGAGEYYGCNINGDYFPEKDLIERHHTFVTNAKVFKEHDNKPTSPSYGHVVFSWYNPKMHRVELILAIDKVKGKEFIDRQARGEQLEVSMGCFPAGTKITMADNQRKNIEDVIPGDMVLTHTGELHEVKTKMMYPYSGDMVTLTMSGQSDTLTATGNHPILVRRYTPVPTSMGGYCPVCGKHLKQVSTHLLRSKQPDHIEYVKNLTDTYMEYTEDWIDARDIKPGDYVVTPIQKYDCYPDNEEVTSVARLLGYFLAEGSYVKYWTPKNNCRIHRAVEFSFSTEEAPYHAEVIRDLKVISNHKATYYPQYHRHVCSIRLQDREVAAKFLSLVGEYSYGKHLASTIFKWGPKAKLALLGAFINGDGTWNKACNVTTATTVSYQLVLDLVTLAAQLGMAVSWCRNAPVPNKHISYILSFSPTQSGQLAEVTDKYKLREVGIPKSNFFRPAVMVEGNQLIRKVIATSSELVENTTVYNFSVDTDESFVAENIAVHNCKVREDVCSICGNKARKRSDYCEHILRDKRKIYPDGRQPYMINYNPTFFDISIVRRRADKIAYVLEKVASQDTTVSSLNAQAFDELDSLIPFAEPPQVFDIEEDFEKTANVEKKAADLDKLAMIKRIQSEAVKVLNTGIEEAMPLIESTEPDLPPALLDTMAKKHRLEDIMTTFTVNAIPMKPEEFTRIVIVKRGMPLDTFADVLKGVKSAIADRDLKMGEYKDDIGKTLQAYLIARSSFLPAVISRLAGALRNRDALSKTAATLKLDVPTNYWELNPALTFGHAKNPPSYTNIESAVAPGAHVIQRYDYSTLPVVRSPQELEMERRRPKLREPMSPLTVGAILGGLYAAYRSSSAVRAVLDSPKNMAILMALAALIHKKMGAPTPTDMQQVKTASWGTTAAKVAIPFVGAHFASAHFRNLYNNGVPLNSVERYIAENPDILSIAAPIVVNAALKGHTNVKTASCDIENSEFMQKFAEVSDSLAEFANNAMLGIILPSKRRSILSNVIDQTIDSKLMNKLLPG